MLQRNIGLIFCVIIVYVYGCPDKCSCNGTVVMCENQGFSFVPQDIPDKTTELFLGRNKIENITENQLGKGASLKKLYLYENRLSHIHPDAFTYLEQLEVLSASYNHLKIIKRQYFWKTIRLKLLDFSKNKIEMIEDGAFEKLPNLQNLRLNSNKIRAISNDTFRMVSGLETLELQDNAIQTIGNLALRDLQNLRLLSMSKNELETLPTGLFNGLDLIEEIYLSSNKLAEIRKGTFKNLSKVKYIVLNKNFVNRVESHAFESLPALERVYLDGNNIKEMQKNCFGNGTKLDRLYLGSNPLRCDCGMKWLMDYVKTHHTSLELESREGSRVDVVCDKPDTLKGRRVLDLPENSFYCECRIPGIMYSGTENKTIKGLGCQYWSDQKPHRHDYDMLGMNQSNYCRNFDRDRAWCLTNQTGVLWDYCYVPVCGNICYDLKSSRSLHRCSMKTFHCSEIDNLVSCHISHVEKTYEIECVDSWMMRRAIVSNLVEHNVIKEQLRLKCFPSPCASENSLKLAKSGTYTGLLPYSQQIFCWSVMRLVNNGIAAITDTNKSVCYTSDKRRFLSAIQTKLEGMWDKTKFQIHECPLTITYDKMEGEMEITRSTAKKIEMFILTNLHYVIGGIAGVLLILVFVLVGRLKFNSKIISKDKKELPNRRSYLNNRQSHVYHEIVDFDQSLKMPYEIEEKKEREGHSYVTLQQKESGPNETPTMVDASHNRLSVLYINTAHSEQYDKSSKSKDTSLKETNLEKTTEGFVKIQTRQEKVIQELNTQLLKTFQYRKGIEPKV